MRNERLIFRPAVVLLVLAFIFGSCGHERRSELSTGLDLPWPPPANRTAAETFQIDGRDAAATGGDTEVQGTSLRMDSALTYAWAIYTATGFSDGIGLAGIELDALLTPGSPGDGSRVWVGLADYEHNRWEWHVMDPTESTFILPLSNGENYIDAGGSASVAAVVDGGGEALLSEVRFEVSGMINVPAPENLTALADVGAITLNWDPVALATGYNIYRSTEPEFPSPVKLNPLPVTSTQYVDATCGEQHRILFYKVSAVRLSESELSDLVDIYTPQIDLPLPGNPRVIERDATSARIAWDWSQGNPDSWDVYVSTKPDFSLNPPPDVVHFNVLGFMRTTLLEDLSPGILYYWRVVPKTIKRGRMTNDNNASATGFWLWGDTEAVGSGNSPIVSCLVDGDISIAHFDNLAVKFGRRNDGTWESQDTGLDTSTSAGGFVDYLDLAFSGGNYLLASYALNPGDLWMAAGDGTPGGWSSERVDGDGSSELGHTTSGMSCHVAVNSSDFFIAYYDNPAQGLKLAVRPIGGGAWAKTDLRFPLQSEPDNSLGMDGDLIGALVMDTFTHELLFADSSNAFATFEDVAAHSSDIGTFNDLIRHSGEWWTPAYDPILRDCYVIHGNSGGWQKVFVDGSDSQAGQYAKLAFSASGTPYLIYKKQNPSRWMLAIYESSAWTLEPIMLTDIGPRPALEVIGETPYIIYQVMGENRIVCVRGVPPE